MEINDLLVTFDPARQAIEEIARLRGEISDLKTSLMTSLPRRDAIMGPNLVVNHSFEDGLAAWYLQDGSPVVDDAQQAEGQYSLRLPSMSSVSSLAFPLSPFFRYRVRARVKGESAAASGLYVRLYVKTTYPSGGFIYDLNGTANYNLTNNGAFVGSWSAKDHIATPANSTYLWGSISFYNWTGGPANAWIDEVYVSPVSYTYEAPSLVNSWVAFGAPFVTPAYMRNLDGTCSLVGSVKNGSIGTVITTLPVGCRPPFDMRFPCASAGVYGEIAIDTAGNVIAVVGLSARMQLDGITFPCA